MDFEYTPEQEAFRTKVRERPRANLLLSYASTTRWTSGSRPCASFEERRLWQAKVNDAGDAVRLAKEYGGGRAAPFMEQIIFDEEYSRARAGAARLSACSSSG